VSVAGDKIVAKAKSLLGTPYVYGVTDCEWLTRTCAAAIGVTIPWGATEQYDDPAVPHVSPPLEPGDFVYFHDVGDPPGEDHCGVYVTFGLMIDAPYTGACTRWDSFSTTEQTGVLQYRGATRPAALVAVSAAPPPAASMVDVKLPTLQQGSTGEAVKALQILLGSNLAPDGVFGPLTTQVVKNLQAANHLAVDGVVGVHTWGTLLGCPQ